MNSLLSATRFLYLFLLFLVSKHSAAQTCTAVASSNWTTSATWSCGHTPNCNDVIVIPSGYTVTISESISLASSGCNGTSIMIYGVLSMNGNASQLNLTATSSISIYSGGKLTTNISNNSQKIVIGSGPAEWSSSDGNLSGPWLIRNGSSGGTLPVELSSFSASCVEQGVTIDWQTQTETDNSYFLVQCSDNAMEWKDLVTIKSQGDGSAKRAYHYLDQNALASAGIAYYRLQQVDAGGHWILFPAVDVNCNPSVSANEMKLYPNPAGMQVSIELLSETTDNTAVLTCTDALNRVVFEMPLEVHPGVNTVCYGLNVPKGLYLLSVKSEVLGIAPQKLVVQD